MKIIIGQRTGVVPSPKRYLYRFSGGKLIFPLDISFDSWNPEKPDGGAKYQDDEVIKTGAKIGKIDAYSFTNGNVDPIVTVTPDAGFDTSEILQQTPLPHSLVQNNSDVYVALATTQIKGTIQYHDPAAAYIDGSHSISAYIVTFDTPLTRSIHGAPVFRTSDDALVGMVIAAKRWNNQPNTLVYSG